MVLFIVISDMKTAVFTFTGCFHFTSIEVVSCKKIKVNILQRVSFCLLVPNQLTLAFLFSLYPSSVTHHQHIFVFELYNDNILIQPSQNLLWMFVLMIPNLKFRSQAIIKRKPCKVSIGHIVAKKIFESSKQRFKKGSSDRWKQFQGHRIVSIFTKLCHNDCPDGFLQKFDNSTSSKPRPPAKIDQSLWLF